MESSVQSSHADCGLTDLSRHTSGELLVALQGTSTLASSEIHGFIISCLFIYLFLNPQIFQMRKKKPNCNAWDVMCNI